jgi:acetyl-CoA C-acetyltransferase
MAEAFVFDHVRTPRGKGKADGSLHEVTAVRLASTVLKSIRDRSDLDASQLDDVVLGCVDPVGEASGDIARSAAIAAGFGEKVPGIQINRFCASGLDAVAFGAAQVMAGQKDMVIGGGVESMSRIGMGASGMMPAVDPSVAIPSYFSPQGVAADLIATKYGFTRDDVDAFAVESHKRAHAAWEAGRFAKSVIPVKDINGLTILAKDETIRPEANMQALGGLKPSFAMMGEQGGFNAVAIQGHPEIETITHVHHAGNSSGIVDGASAVLIGSRGAGRKAGIKPRAKIRGFASLGSDLALVLTGPVDVTNQLLARTGMTIKDIDLVEINEAFSAVVLRYLQAFDMDPAKVNVNGGAIAMGHPLGATGAMILGTVIDELERRDLNTGLVTLCVAHGMGTAMIVERV